MVMTVNMKGTLANSMVKLVNTRDWKVNKTGMWANNSVNLASNSKMLVNKRCPANTYLCHCPKTMDWTIDSLKSANRLAMLVNNRWSMVNSQSIVVRNSVSLSNVDLWPDTMGLSANNSDWLVSNWVKQHPVMKQYNLDLSANTMAKRWAMVVNMVTSRGQVN